MSLFHHIDSFFCDTTMVSWMTSTALYPFMSLLALSPESTEKVCSLLYFISAVRWSVPLFCRDYHVSRSMHTNVSIISARRTTRLPSRYFRMQLTVIIPGRLKQLYLCVNWFVWGKYSPFMQILCPEQPVRALTDRPHLIWMGGSPHRHDHATAAAVVGRLTISVARQWKLVN